MYPTLLKCKSIVPLDTIAVFQHTHSGVPKETNVEAVIIGLLRGLEVVVQYYTPPAPSGSDSVPTNLEIILVICNSGASLCLPCLPNLSKIFSPTENALLLKHHPRS